MTGCAFDGCERPHSARGLCATHYAQHRRGRALIPINDRVPATLRDSEGRKRCSTCKEWLPIDRFRIHSRKPDGLMGACIRCMRHRVVARRYGISLDTYERIAAAQGEVCAICGTPGSGRRALAIDHHHGTGHFRGLLCSPCNTGLGQFKDDPDLLRAAIAYLAAGGVDVGD